MSKSNHTRLLLAALALLLVVSLSSSARASGSYLPKTSAGTAVLVTSMVAVYGGLLVGAPAAAVANNLDDEADAIGQCTTLESCAELRDLRARQSTLANVSITSFIVSAGGFLLLPTAMFGVIDQLSAPAATTSTAPQAARRVATSRTHRRLLTTLRSVKLMPQLSPQHRGLLIQGQF